MKPYLNPALVKKMDEIEATHVPSTQVTEIIAELRVQRVKHELLPGVVPIWHSELQQMEVQEPSWLVDQLISKNGINAISGLPESHKSFIALDIAKAVSLGEPFLGKFATERTKVLIIDEENTWGRSKMRLGYLSEEALDIVIAAEQHIKIDRPGTTQGIIEYCHANEIGVVVFDSLSSIHLADESSNPQMSKVFEELLRLIQAGLTVIFIHHEPKNSKGDPAKASLRGAGDILAKCDTHISFRHPAHDVNNVIAQQLKNRDAERLPEFTISVNREQDHTWFEYVGEAPKQVGAIQRTDDAIVELLRTDGELNQSQILKALQPIEGLLGQKKKADRLAILCTTKLSTRSGDHNATLYSLKSELNDEYSSFAVWHFP